ncbi:MAG: 23S rRNA (adenine(2030)-N(6))-methyltransferase RlmJ [Xanthomonadaceae bacterium]|jgi:23S rRNA (adenine2030-N6)-methyltransferase|nr:23S rRNA (adenine(2030)-N(6))-methyltransferase RlmJ [Xanthomonadaceae bacterium]
MNYRHAFHAGNFADVLKHAVLVALLRALTRKDAPLAYVDTHAGAGSYDLGGPEAARTLEHAAGIGRLLATPGLPDLLRDYLTLVRGDAADGAALREYPGSPLIAARLLRATDRLLLCELQDAECAALRLAFAGDPRVAVQQRDGYAALAALLPPRERRGLVLVDPPFEAQDAEFRAIEAALAAAFRRFAQGVYAIWYPIKLRRHVAPFHRWLRGCGMPKVLVAEVLLRPDDAAQTLNGCGVAIVNTPWQVDQVLAPALAALPALLGAARGGGHRLEWLVGEDPATGNRA